LARITVRLARRNLRLRKARRWVGLESLPSAEGIAPGASPEEKAILSSVYAVLHSLPANERIAWTLRHLEGETLPAIAELCGCSLATAKRRISAAQDAIRRSMAHE
jgi:RNA polymerase sigma-70 factor (ECF subfamily)